MLSMHITSSPYHAVLVSFGIYKYALYYFMLVCTSAPLHIIQYIGTSEIYHISYICITGGYHRLSTKKFWPRFWLKKKFLTNIMPGLQVAKNAWDAPTSSQTNWMVSMITELNINLWCIINRMQIWNASNAPNDIELKSTKCN